MNVNVERLYEIAGKPKRRIIGLMSGTSLDGLDVVVCGIEGSGMGTKLTVENFETVPYEPAFRAEVLQVFSKRTADLEKVCLLNGWIAGQHAQMINDCLAKWDIPRESVDLIASHGQTIYHAPQHLHNNHIFGSATLQIGDGDHIAVKTGIITISDFRQKNIAAGGEGAPLAAYGDIILFGNPETDTVLLNIGGITNFTFLPAAVSSKKMFSTDAGPGNTLMDAWMQKNFPGQTYDRDALVARQGTVNNKLLVALNDHPFFDLPFPKSTGPELFSAGFLADAIKRAGAEKLDVNDVMATLNAFTASVICDSIKKIKNHNDRLEIFISGGGMHNPMVLEYVRNNIPGVSIQSTAAKNIDPDAKEAILFALLANECVAGDAQTFASFFPATGMGKISFPS
jgi:anhydro-N-acetylmuramic acid kinase